MGRTIEPYSYLIERVRDRFRKFRQSLRKEDQRIFDQLMVYVKLHVQAGVMASFPNPADPVFISILIEQQRQIEKLKNQIESIKENQKQNTDLIEVE